MLEVMDLHFVRDLIEMQGTVQLIAAYALVAIVAFLSLQFLFGIWRNAVPKICVPLPHAAQFGWSGKVLSNPSIMAEDPSLIQCYCPATGQLIDTIPAATTADIDVAIRNAKRAQLQWRQTTFKQRKLVLKTILKFILENQGSIL